MGRVVSTQSTFFFFFFFFFFFPFLFRFVLERTSLGQLQRLPVCLFVFFWVFCACLWLRGVCVSFALLLWLVGLVDDFCPFRASSILCCLVAVSSHDMHNEQ